MLNNNNLKGLCLSDPSIVSMLKSDKNTTSVFENLKEFYVSTDNEITRGVRNISSYKNNIVYKNSSVYRLTNFNNADFFIETFKPLDKIDLLTKKIFQILNIVIVENNPNRIGEKTNRFVYLNFEMLLVLFKIDIKNKSAVDAFRKKCRKCVLDISKYRFGFAITENNGMKNNCVIEFCWSVSFGEYTGPNNVKLVDKNIIVFEISEPYTNFCISGKKNRGKLTKVPTAIFTLKNPVSYGIAEALARQFFDAYNSKNSRNRIASFATLLKYSGLPSQQLVKSKNRDYRGRIILPFLKALVELEKGGIIRIKDFHKKNNVKLLVDEDRALKLEIERIVNNERATEGTSKISINFFLSLYLEFEICNA